jgi:DNA replication protein DnaC
MIDQLGKKLRQLCLSYFANNYQTTAETCEKNNQSHVEFLHTLACQELEYRHHRRIERLLKQAKLPRVKTLKSFDVKRIKGLSISKIKQLATGDFIDKCENILIFGNPGTGKTHLSIALAQEWCLQGRRVFYTTVAKLIQDLLKAKEELKLHQLIKKLDRFEVLIIDDISYTACSRDEADVLFQLLSERYEMRSILITSNLPFTKWECIFKDTMTTTAAIDRLVHHASILELNAESYRIKTAKQKKEVNSTDSKT